VAAATCVGPRSRSARAACRGCGRRTAATRSVGRGWRAGATGDEPGVCALRPA
jgi:hypothetical protein